MIKNISSVCNRNRNKIYVCYSFCIHLGLRLSPRVLLRPSWKSIFITTFKVKAGWFFNIRALHQVCIQNLLCGDVEGALTTRTQWHVSTLKACLKWFITFISIVQNPFPPFKIHFHRSKFISIVQNPFPPGWNWGGRMLATGCSSSPRWKVSLLLFFLLGPAFAVSLDTPGWNQSRKWFSCHFTYFLVHRTFIIPSSTWQVPSTNPVTSCSSSSR